MLKLIAKVVLLTVIVMAICYVLVMVMNKVPNHNKAATNHYSPSRLLIMPSNHDFELVLAGRSQTDNITMGPNYDSTQAILNKDFFNIAKPSVGVLPLHVLMEYFYHKHNTCKKVLLFIDGPMF